MSQAILKLAIEIEAYCYGDPNHVRDERQSDEQFQQYIQDCLVYSGLDRLKPVAPGYMFYEISELDDSALATVLAYELSDFFEDEPELYETVESVREFFPAFSGGFAIFDAEELVSTPGCCCRFDDLSEWRQFSTELSHDFQDLWVGHDSESVALRLDNQGERIELEIRPWEQPGPLLELSMRLVDFESTMEQTASELRNLANRVAMLLPENVSDNTIRMAIGNKIVGLG